jgi:hypothetical protein
MNDATPFLLTFLLLCLCPSGLIGLGIGLGWFLRGRGGLPRIYWPQSPVKQDDIDDE